MNIYNCFHIFDLISKWHTFAYAVFKPFLGVTWSEKGNESSSFGVRVHSKRETCLLLVVLETWRTAALIMCISVKGCLYYNVGGGERKKTLKNKNVVLLNHLNVFCFFLPHWDFFFLRFLPCWSLNVGFNRFFMSHSRCLLFEWMAPPAVYSPKQSCSPPIFSVSRNLLLRILELLGKVLQWGLSLNQSIDWSMSVPQVVSGNNLEMLLWHWTIQFLYKNAIIKR